MDREQEAPIIMTVPMCRAVAVLGLLSILAGCSSGKVPWVNPELPRERAADDYAECRRYADDQVDPTHGAADANRSDTVVSRGDRDEDKRRRAVYLRACMEGKGYKPAR